MVDLHPAATQSYSNWRFLAVVQLAPSLAVDFMRDEHVRFNGQLKMAFHGIYFACGLPEND